MVGYRPRPSATRYGQRVDNPPLEHSDTGRFAVLLREENQDKWDRQEKINGEAYQKLTTLYEWRQILWQNGGVADRRDIRNLWVAFSAVLGVAVTLILLLLGLLLKK